MLIRSPQYGVLGIGIDAFFEYAAVRTNSECFSRSGRSTNSCEPCISYCFTEEGWTSDGFYGAYM